MFILMADSVPSECASMPLHHRVVLAAHDGSLGVVRVIRVQKRGVTIETITQVSDRERKREREREKEIKRERERERQRETESRISK